jgi:hypothetical protein
MVRVAMLVVLVLLVLPSAANADRLDRVNRLAVQMWGPVLTDVCPDGLTVRYERAQYDTLGWAWQNRCEIGLNSRRDALESWSPFCDTVLHEAGHILGYDHDYMGRGRIMSTQRMLSYDEIVFPSGRVVGKWRGVNRWCQPGGGPAPASMAVRVGDLR